LKFLKAHTWFLVILSLCALLRLLPLASYQFTYDELSALERTQFNSFSDLVHKGVKIDAHPALIQLLIFALVKCFGYVTWLIKLPFILFSLGSVCYAYAFGLRYFSKQAGLLSAVFFSFSLPFVFYAPVARMYIPGIFFSVAMLYYFYGIFFNGNRTWLYFLMLGLTAWLGALNHHMSALFAFTLFLAGLLMIRRVNAKPFLITLVVVLLAYLPHLPVTLYQLGVGGIGRDQGGWLEPPGWDSFFLFLKMLCGASFNWLIIALLILLGRIHDRKWRLNRKQVFLLAMFFFNYAVIFLYSVTRAPVYQHSVMLFSGVAAALLLCSLAEVSQPVISSIVLWLTAFTLIHTTYIKKDYLGQCVRTVYEYQFQRTLHYIKLYGENNVAPLFFDADALMQKIYFKKYGTSFPCAITTDSMMAYPNKIYKIETPGGTREISSVRLFSGFVSGLKADYVVLSSSTPLHEAIVAARYPYLIENTQTQSNYFRVYSRKNSDSLRVVPGSEIIHTSDLTHPGVFEYEIQPGSSSSKMVIQTGSEFPFAARSAYAAAIPAEGTVMLARAVISPANSALHNVQLCISVKDSTTNETINYSSKSSADFVPGNGRVTLLSDQFFGTTHRRALRNGNLACYVWNTEKDNIRIGNFSLSTVNYWSEKWQFWN
jgi:hypothetical protein